MAVSISENGSCTTREYGGNVSWQRRLTITGN